MTIAADDPDDVALTEDEVAEILSVSVRTLQFWRTHRDGPPFMRFGRLVRYSKRALIEWMKSKTDPKK
jgi:excisionase family DNA binding protein